MPKKKPPPSTPFKPVAHKISRPAASDVVPPAPLLLVELDEYRIRSPHLNFAHWFSAAAQNRDAAAVSSGTAK
jgi:hypothetical protein